MVPGRHEYQERGMIEKLLFGNSCAKCGGSEKDMIHTFWGW